MDAGAIEEQTAYLTDFRAYVRFESRDPNENRDRYYDLLWQPTLFGEGALVRVWGRRGQSATTRVTTYSDRSCAQGAVRQLVQLRLRHGYQVTDWH
jgi:predicted DNA-binding WGR domain protein